MKRTHVLLTGLILTTPLFLGGCSNDFKDNVAKGFISAAGSMNEMRVEIEDLQSQIKAIKQQLNMPTEAKLSKEDVKFNSIKVLTTSGQEYEDTVQLASGSEFGIAVEILNTTEEDLKNLSCVVSVEYYNGDNFFNTFRKIYSPISADSKIVTRGIEVNGLELSPNHNNLLKIEIKDAYGNTVNEYKKPLKVS